MAKIFYLILSVLALCIMLPRIEAVRPKYQHFDDYLNSLDRRDQSWLSEQTQNSADSQDEGGDEEVFEDSSTTTPSTTTTTAGSLLNPQQTQEVTCCLLGQIAGDKGYHCYVQYYAARLILRNRNRTHNRKMNFYGRERIPNYGEKVMKTFGQCLNGMGNIFHKCCHLASLERRSQRYDTVVRERALRSRHNNTTQQPQDDSS